MVGVDASACARDAAGWAADLATAWSAPLHLVHVIPVRSSTAEVPEWLGALADAARRAGAAESPAEVLSGHPVDALAERSAGARLLVVGSYGEGAESGMLAGSLALGLLGRAACPVAVVRGPERDMPPPRTGPVVVGVDGSPAARAALDIAAGLAAVLGTRLVVLRTWSEVVAGPHGAARRPEPPAQIAADAGAGLDADLDVLAASHPGLEVEPVVVEDTPVRALLDRAGSARLLLVGHRDDDPGAPGRAGMLAGSTSRSLVEFAACPVLVTRAVHAGEAS